MGAFNAGNFGGLQPGFVPPPIPALTGADIAYVAYRIAGILPEPGRGYSGSEGVDALRILNSLINSMQAERLMVWAYVRTLFTTVAGQKSYKIGTAPGADWLIPRPEEITLAGYVFTNVNPFVECPMQILTYQDWAALSPKELQSPISYMGYYQPDVPNGTFFLWPVPTDVSILIALYTWTNLQRIDQLTTAMILPPGYQELLEYGLAIRLAGMFPRRSRLDPNAPAMYLAARERVMTVNEPELKMQCEMGSGGVRQSVGRFNILSGTNIGGTGWSGG